MTPEDLCSWGRWWRAGKKSRHPSRSALKELRKIVQESIEEQIHFKTNGTTMNWKKDGSSKLKLIEALMFHWIYFHFSFLLPLWICYQKDTLGPCPLPGGICWVSDSWHAGLLRHRTCWDILSNPVCCTWRQSKEDANSSMQAANCTASTLSGKSQAQRGTMINAASPNAIINA